MAAQTGGAVRAAAPEAEAVYGVLGMPFSDLVFGLRQFYSQVQSIPGKKA
jgi:hypothetical protein